MNRWLQRRFYPRLAAALIRLLGATIHLVVHDPHGLVPQKKRAPVLFAFWHNRLFLTPCFQRRLLSPRTLAAMISRSRDGTFIADVIHEFGLYSARGSSSRRGSAALLALIHWLKKDGVDAAITPDGPRGPRHKLHPGILHLARTTGCPIVPLRIEFSCKIELKSWDRFQVPLPFSRCDLHFGAPLNVPSTATDDELKAFAVTLTEQLGD